MMIPSVLVAQNYGSINTFSPYSMYGLGDLNTPGTLNTRSMGGMGVAMRSTADINLLNPASYSMALNRSVLFSYGMEGYNVFNKQDQSGSSVTGSYAGVNIHDIAIQIPITRKLGMGISLTPYSSTGYDISSMEYLTDIGLVTYNYSGDGDVTQVKLGVGWSPIKNLSIGLATQYYWGDLTRSFTMTPYVITGNGAYYSTIGESRYDVGSLKGQVGVQWSAISDVKRNLTFGATYDFGGDLKPTFTHTVIGYGSLFAFEALSEESTLSLMLPNQITAGFVYQTPKYIVGLDYNRQDWYSKNSNTVEYTASGVAVAYNDFQTVKLGAQYTPNRADVRQYSKRISYRVGARYGGYQYSFNGQNVKQAAVTMGVSLPIKTSGITKLDLGLEYGEVSGSDLYIDSYSSVGFIGKKYFKFSMGFTLFGEDYWFQRPKFD